MDNFEERRSLLRTAAEQIKEKHQYTGMLIEPLGETRAMLSSTDISGKLHYLYWMDNVWVESDRKDMRAFYDKVDELVANNRYKATTLDFCREDGAIGLYGCAKVGETTTHLLNWDGQQWIDSNQ